MYDMCKIGKYEPTPDALDREMYHTALKMIRDAGYEHYEISNCALEGCRSRHNMKYWSYDEYLGLGLGASSFTGGKRYKNVSDMREYIDIINRDRKPTDTCSVEEYTQREEMGIYMFTGLRKTEGVSSRDFAGTFHRDIFDVYPESILRKYRGLLIFTGDRLYLTERGMDISNRIMAEFL